MHMGEGGGGHSHIKGAHTYFNELGCSISHSQGAGVQTRRGREEIQLHHLVQPTDGWEWGRGNE